MARIEIDSDDFEKAKKLGIGYRIVKEKKKKMIEKLVREKKLESWGRQRASTRLNVTRVPLHIAKGGHQFGNNPLRKKVYNILESDYVF
jgi:hypothetical protein